jgi:excisionase family DNA binding protein
VRDPQSDQNLKKNGKDLRRHLADLPDVLTVEEAASLLRIGRNTAYEMVRRGQIPHVNLGVRATRIPKRSLESLLGLTVEQEGQTAAGGPGGNES